MHLDIPYDCKKCIRVLRTACKVRLSLISLVLNFWESQSI